MSYISEDDVTQLYTVVLLMGCDPRGSVREKSLVSQLKKFLGSGDLSREGWKMSILEVVVRVLRCALREYKKA